MSLSIIVLAAGKGSRMLSAKPKVLHEVGNYPMLFHILDSINSFKDAKVKVVIASSFSQFKSEIKIVYVHARNAILSGFTPSPCSLPHLTHISARPAASAGVQGLEIKEGRGVWA